MKSNLLYKILIINTIIFLSVGCLFGKKITINKISTAPIIDGELENVWNNLPSYKMEESKGTNGEGFSAEFKMCFDNTNLYIAVMVTDPTPNVSGNSGWQSDNVELYFAFDTIGKPKYYVNGENNAFQFRKIAAKNQNELGLEGPQDIADYNVKVAQTDGAAYIQEWSLPWTYLCKNFDWNGQAFMFEIEAGQANDPEIGREYLTFWNSNADDQYNIINNQGIVVLETYKPDSCVIERPLLMNKISELENEVAELQKTKENYLIKANTKTIYLPGTDIYFTIKPGNMPASFLVESNYIVDKVEVYDLNNIMQSYGYKNSSSFEMYLPSSGIEYVVRFYTDKGTAATKLKSKF